MYFSLQILPQIFLVLKIIQRHIINVHKSSCKEPIILNILIKLQFSRQIFQKYLDIKEHENPYSGSRVVPCGRTERRTDMTKVIAAFRNSPKALKIIHNAFNNCDFFTLVASVGVLNSRNAFRSGNS